jgi:hypothetical protein
MSRRRASWIPVPAAHWRYWNVVLLAVLALEVAAIVALIAGQLR